MTSTVTRIYRPQQGWVDFSRGALSITLDTREERSAYVTARISSAVDDGLLLLQCVYCRRELTVATADLVTQQHVQPNRLWSAVVPVCRGSDACTQEGRRICSEEFMRERVRIAAANPTIPMQRVCAWCKTQEAPNTNKEARFLKCSRCRVAHYCSFKCQRESWPMHAKYCFKASRKSAASVPGLCQSSDEECEKIQK